MGSLPRLLNLTMTVPSDEPDDSIPAFPETGSARPQFRIWDIGLAILAVGVLCAVTRRLPWSETHLWFYLSYFGTLGLYLALRLPPIVRAIRYDYRQVRARKQRILREAETLRRR